MLMDYLLTPENIEKYKLAWNKATVEQRTKFLTNNNVHSSYMSCAKKKWKNLPFEVQSVILSAYRPLIL